MISLSPFTILWIGRVTRKVGNLLCGLLSISGGGAAKPEVGRARDDGLSPRSLHVDVGILSAQPLPFPFAPCGIHGVVITPTRFLSCR
jgi:hypothetical protein